MFILPVTNFRLLMHTIPLISTGSVMIKVVTYSNFEIETHISMYRGLYKI